MFRPIILLIVVYVSLTHSVFTKPDDAQNTVLNQIKKRANNNIIPNVHDNVVEGNADADAAHVVKAVLEEDRYIVHLHKEYVHSDFEVEFFKLKESVAAAATEHNQHKQSKIPKIHHKYDKLLHGFCTSGISEETLLKMKGVESVVLDSIKYKAATSWGIDRINQANLPLDSDYTRTYTGDGIDVYVVDTGIDTLHDEFAAVSGVSRTVSNIFNAFGSVTTNTDGDGHGTHCAGTVGGSTIGVAPSASIFGCKVLSDDGSGSTSGVIAGLEAAVTYSLKRSKPSIVSMSLGSAECDTKDCQKDSLVIAVNALATYNIAAAIAAGNSHCNACQGSPAAAASSIVVGATDKSDTITYFSNFGQCVDILAPGNNINSACSSKVSGCTGSESKYSVLSGTSMACPHVAGVLAQLFSKNKAATVAELKKALICDATEGVAALWTHDTITRDLLLRSPVNDGTFGTCDMTSSCTNNCNDEGICLTVPSISSLEQCYCEGDYFGPTCNVSGFYDSTKTGYNQGHLITISKTDSRGYGWEYSHYAILDANSTKVVSNGMDSLCDGKSDTDTYSLPAGTYQLVVDAGVNYYNTYVGWSMCESSGSSPFTGTFYVDDYGGCTFDYCENVGLELSMYAKTTAGWDGDSSFSVYDAADPSSAVQTGTLASGVSGSEYLCLSEGTYFVTMSTTMTSYDRGVSYEICGVTGKGDDIIIFSVNSAGVCSIVNTDMNEPCATSMTMRTSMYMMNYDSLGWSGKGFAISAIDASGAVAANSMYSGKLGNTLHINGTAMCLPDGSYSLSVKGSSSDEFSICGYTDSAPYTGTVTIESLYGLCYGLTGCPVTRSTSPAWELQQMFVANSDNTLMYLADAHGVIEWCNALVTGFQYFYIGFGQASSGVMKVCDVDYITSPAMVKVSYSSDGVCTVVSSKSYTCSSSKTAPVLVMKYDKGGDGWANGKSATVAYTLSTYSNSDLSVKFTGVLASGNFGVDNNCLTVGTTYYLQFTGSSTYTVDAYVGLCGYTFNAYSIQSYGYLSFSVLSDGGCVIDQIEANSRYDDDFPASPSLSPSIKPSVSPSLKPLASTPSTAPTIRPSSLRPTLKPTAVPSTPPTRQPTRVPTRQPTRVPTRQPTRVPTRRPTRRPTRKPTFKPSSTSN